MRLDADSEKERIAMEDILSINGSDGAGTEGAAFGPEESLKKDDSYIKTFVELLLIGLFFALLVFIAIWPVGFHWGDQLIGDYEGDFWKHFWGHWWVCQSLDRGILPLFCDLINAPRGGYLYIADPCNALIVYALKPFMSFAAAQNVLIALNLWMGMAACWLLADYFIRDRICSAAAAVVYGLSGYVLSYPVSSGVSETLNTAWAPLFIYFLHRLLDRGRFRDMLGMAVFFALTTFSCWYYGEFMAVYTAAAFLYKTSQYIIKYWRGRSYKISELLRFKRARAGFLCSFGRWFKTAFPHLKIHFLQICCAIIMGAVMISPFAIAFKLVVSNSANIVMPAKAPKRSISRMRDYMGNNSEVSVNIRGINGFHNYTNLLGLFLPGKGNATVTVTVDRLVRVHYLGWIAVILGLFAWRRRRNNYIIYYLGAAFLFFLILSLGQKITYSDFSPQGFLNPVYLLMFLFFPFFYNIAIPFRLLMISLICLGILASWGMKELLKRQTYAKKCIFSCFICFCMLLEIIFVSPLPWPLPVSPVEVPNFYNIIAADPRDYAIIDYPFERPGARLIPSEYFYYQTVHGKKIPYRTSGVLSWELSHNFFMEEILLAQNGVLASSKTKKNFERGIKSLLDMKFKYFILHERLLPGFTALDIENRLIPYLGEPMRFGDGTVVFQIKDISSTENEAD